MLTVPLDWSNFFFVESALHFAFYSFCVRSGAPVLFWRVGLLLSAYGSVWVTREFLILVAASFRSGPVVFARKGGPGAKYGAVA